MEEQDSVGTAQLPKVGGEPRGAKPGPPPLSFPCGPRASGYLTPGPGGFLCSVTQRHLLCQAWADTSQGRKRPHPEELLSWTLSTWQGLRVPQCLPSPSALGRQGTSGPHSWSWSRSWVWVTAPSPKGRSSQAVAPAAWPCPEAAVSTSSCRDGELPERYLALRIGELETKPCAG